MAQLASFCTADLGEATPALIRQGLARLDGLQRLSAGSYFEALGDGPKALAALAGRATTGQLACPLSNHLGR